MTFISYAQNYEDVILYRALKSVEKGFYIDVGAQDPILDSVTKAFYERGWRGINIEPVNYWFNKLLEERPEDTNLMVAAAAQSGTLKLFEVVGTGLSTADASFAEKHAAAGFEVQKIEVPALRLDDICDRLNVSEIHFLKIDVEGTEGAVLDGIDLNRLRPWVILLESTEPNSTVPTHEQWEGTLTTYGYVFVYFDGLNRYYVPKERAGQLKAALSTPPNYFDYFIRYPEWYAEQYAKKMKAEAADAQSRLQLMETDLSQLHAQDRALREGLTAALRRTSAAEGELSRLRDAMVQMENRLVRRESELGAVYRSISWRLTAPLRKAKFFVKRLILVITGISDLHRLPRRAMQKFISSILMYLRSRPECKITVARLLARFPRLDAIVRASVQIHSGRPVASLSMPDAKPTFPPDLSGANIRWEAYSPSVRDAYKQLIRERTNPITHQDKKRKDPV